MTKRMNLTFGKVNGYSNALNRYMFGNYVFTSLAYCIITYALFCTRENHRGIRIRVFNSMVIDWVMYKQFFKIFKLFKLEVFNDQSWHRLPSAYLCDYLSSAYCIAIMVDYLPEILFSLCAHF